MVALGLRAEMRKTLAQREGMDFSGRQFAIKAELCTERGRQCARQIIYEGVLSPQITTVRELIMMLGMATLHVFEHREPQDSPVSAFVYSDELAREVPSDAVQVGDGVITFYPPDCLRTISSGRVPFVVEHEFWHLFLAKAFPAYQREMDKMQDQTKQPVPYFKGHFINPFSHFFLRAAALEAGREQFVIADAEEEYCCRVRGIEEAKENARQAGGSFGRMTAVTLYAGLLFSHVFPFELFPAFSVVTRRNLEAIKTLMTGVLDAKLLAEADDLVRSVLQVCLGTDGEIKMHDFCDPILRTFQAFASQGA